MEERFLYHIWDAGHLLPELKTVSGKPLRIRYQGQYNTNRGPDFCNAMLDLDGELLQGDVEIHINSYDWTAHNHQEDHYYNKVILHVVLNCNQQTYTIKENGEAVEILELKDQLSEDIRKLLENQRFDIVTEPSTYCDLLSAVDNDTLISSLNSFGRQRFRNKVRRFNAALLLSDFDQVLYEGMMEALGYDKNKLNLLNLAQSIPLQRIRDWQQEGLTAPDLIAIFCCSSGLLEKCSKILDAEFIRVLKETYETQKFCAQTFAIDWQLFRIRPANHPIFRIIALSALVYRTLDQGFLPFWLEHVHAASSDPKKNFRAFYQVFAQATLPGMERLPKPGKSLAGNIYLNIYLPILQLYFEKIGGSREIQDILTLYSEFPPLQENHITRFMSRYLSPAQVAVASQKSIYQQGLIEIFYRYCHYHLCDECLAARNRA